MPARVADAYSAAQALNSKFKLFISFDMTCVLSTSLSFELNGTQVSQVHIAARHLLATGVYYPLCRAPEPVHLQRKAVCVDLCGRRLLLWWRLQLGVECIQEGLDGKVSPYVLPSRWCLIESVGALCPFVLHRSRKVQGDICDGWCFQCMHARFPIYFS
jgi:hypothetical protein